MAITDELSHVSIAPSYVTEASRLLAWTVSKSIRVILRFYAHSSVLFIKMTKTFTCEQFFQSVIPGVCVFCGGVVEVQCFLLQPPSSPPAVEESEAEHGSPRLLARHSPSLHLHGENVLQQHHTCLHHALFPCSERCGQGTTCELKTLTKTKSITSPSGMDKIYITFDINETFNTHLFKWSSSLFGTIK